MTEHPVSPGQDPALDEAFVRMDEVQARARQAAGEFIRTFLSGWKDLWRRLEDAKKEFERRAGQFRGKLGSSVPVSEEEFRARLLTLDMEYESRCRVAEQGLKFLGDHFEKAFRSMENWIGDFCAQLEQSLRSPQGISPKTLEALGLLDRSDREKYEARLRAAQEEMALLQSRTDEQAMRRLEERLRALKLLLEEKDRRIRDLESGSPGRPKQDEEERAQALYAELKDKEQTADSQAKRQRDYFSGILGKLSKRLLELERRLGGKEEELGRLRKSLEEAKRGGKEAASRGAAKKAPGQEYGRRIAEQVEQFIHTMHQERDAIQNLLQSAQESLAAGRSAPPQNAAQWEGERRQLVDQLAAANRQLNTLKAEYDEFKSSLEQTLLKKEYGRQVAEQAEELLQAMRQERDSLQSVLRSAQESLAAGRPLASATKAEWEAERDRLVDQLAAANRQLKAVKEEHGQHKATLEQSEQFLGAMRQERDAFQKLLQSARESLAGVAGAPSPVRLDKWAAEREQLIEQLAKVTRELNVVRGEYEEYKGSLEATFLKMDARRLEEMFKLKGQVETLQKALKAQGGKGPKEG